MAKNIQRDLQLGQQAEKRLIALLEKNKFVCEIHNKYEYDILATKKFRKVNYKSGGFKAASMVSITFEVKWDIMAEKTGNIALEYYNSRSNKDSGISSTKADFWIHTTNVMWAIPVIKLKQLIKDIKPKRIITNGGDKNANLYLYPISFLEEHFTNLEELTTRKLNRFLTEV